jgi:hypothetical protein
MATTTTNFGWDIPQSTDLVKDGATAIAALGQDIDTAFVDLKGGTTGQVLSKASGTDLDFSWVAQGSSPSYALINTGGTSLSGSTTTISSISGKNDLYIWITGLVGGDGNGYGSLTFRMNSDTGSNYDYVAGEIMSTNTSGTSLQTVDVQGSGQTSIKLYEGKTPLKMGIRISGANAAGVKPVQWDTSGLNANDYNARVFGQGHWSGSASVSSISIISSGTFSAGTIFVYGA